MTGSFVRDDVLEAVLQSRAGDAAPADLHGVILAAVVADRPRVNKRRSIRHPWRLLAVAAVLLTTIGTAALVGGWRLSERPPTRAPSPLAIANPSELATPSPTFKIVEITPVPESPLPSCDQVEAFSAATHATVGASWGTSSPSPIGAAVKAGSIAAWADHSDGTSDVVLVDPTSGKRTKLLALGIVRNKYADFEWAPDGSTLAIGFDSDVCVGGILVQTRDRSVLLRREPSLTYDAEEGSFAWSPDSTRLVVEPFGRMNDAGGTHHWIVPRDGSAITDLAPPCERCNTMFYRWSPDGRWLGAQYEQFDELGASSEAIGNGIGIGIVIFDTTTGRWTVIPETTGEAVLGWQDDHVLIGQQSTSDGHGRLIAYDAMDGSRSVLPYEARDAFRLLPNGSKAITFTQTGSGATERDSIGLQDLATGQTTTLWTGAKGLALGGGVVAPDGSAIAMTGGTNDQETDTWVVRLDGSGATRLRGVTVGRTGWQPILR